MFAITLTCAHTCVEKLCSICGYPPAFSPVRHGPLPKDETPQHAPKAQVKTKLEVGGQIFRDDKLMGSEVSNFRTDPYVLRKV